MLARHTLPEETWITDQYFAASEQATPDERTRARDLVKCWIDGLSRPTADADSTLDLRTRRSATSGFALVCASLFQQWLIEFRSNGGVS
jgi:hypothetical protein